MWQLVFELKNKDEQVVNTIILFVLDNAFIEQPIHAAKCAEDFITMEAERQAELAKLFMPMLTAYLHYNAFNRTISTDPTHETKVFFIETLIITCTEKLRFDFHYYDSQTKERRTGCVSYNEFHDKLRDEHKAAYQTIPAPENAWSDKTRKAWELYYSPSKAEKSDWINKLHLYSKDFLPRHKPIQYLPMDVVDFKSNMQIASYIKHNVIIALYNAATDYYCIIWEETIGNNSPELFKKKRESFNDKFKGIAQIQGNGSLSSLAETFEKLEKYTLYNDEDNLNFEKLIDGLLLRCAPMRDWLADGGRAYFGVLNHLNDMNTQLCQGALLEFIKPTKHLFNIIILENLPTGLRWLCVIPYKNFFERMLKGVGVVGDLSRFGFNSFVKELCQDRGNVLNQAPHAASQGNVIQGGSNNNNLQPLPPAEHRQTMPRQRSHASTLFSEHRTKKRSEDVIPNRSRPPRKKRRTMAEIMMPIYKYMASDDFNRLMIGIAIGAGIAFIVAIFVGITYLSGGTFIAAAAAAAGLAAIGGTGGLLGTLAAGIAVFSFLGGLFAHLFNKHKEKKSRGPFLIDTSAQNNDQIETVTSPFNGVDTSVLRAALGYNAKFEAGATETVLEDGEDLGQSTHDDLLERVEEIDLDIEDRQRREQEQQFNNTANKVGK